MYLNMKHGVHSSVFFLCDALALRAVFDERFSLCVSSSDDVPWSLELGLYGDPEAGLPPSQYWTHELG